MTLNILQIIMVERKTKDVNSDQVHVLLKNHFRPHLQELFINHYDYLEYY